MSSCITLSIYKVARQDSYLFQLHPPADNTNAVVIACPHDLAPSASQVLKEQVEQTVLLLNSLVEQRHSGTSSNQRHQTDPLQAFGRMLYNQIIPHPIQEALQQIPDSSIINIVTNDRDLPWELLHDGTEYLGLKHIVARQIMVEQWSHRQRALPAIKRQSQNILLIGNPTGDLPEAAQEVEQLASLFDQVPGTSVQILMNRRATKGSLLQRLASNKYDLIHYSGHAMFDAADPTASGLLLAGEEVLTATDIAQHLSGTPFVFLNGCWSAQQQSERTLPPDKQVDIPYWGQVGQDLTSAFIHGGASGFIGSYWPIYDASSREFCLAYYRHIVDGVSIGAAFRTARNESREHSPNEPLWASYVLYGNPQQQLWSRRKIQRRPATVLVVRIIGLDALLSHTDVVDSADFIDRQMALVVDAIAQFRGEVHSIIHGEIVGTFGLTSAQQNDTEQALHAAWAIRDLFIEQQSESNQSKSDQPKNSGLKNEQSEFAQPKAEQPKISLGVAIGISSGDLRLGYIESQGQSTATITGDAVVQAHALAARATNNELLISEAVRRLARRSVHIDLETSNVVDSSGGFSLYQVQKLTERSPSDLLHTGRHTPEQVLQPQAALVGRQDELAFLRSAWQRCLGGQGQIVDISGAAGIGKSRLIYEFYHSLEVDDIRCLWVVCPSAYTPRPYWLIGQCVRVLCDVAAEEDRDITRQKIEQRLRELSRKNLSEHELLRDLAILCDTQGIPVPQFPLIETDATLYQQQLTTLLAHLFDLAASSPLPPASPSTSPSTSLPRPQILVLEDLHGADEASLEIFNQFLKRIDRVPLLVISSWRAEEIERQSPWQNHRRRHALHIMPFSAEESRLLLTTLLEPPKQPRAQHDPQILPAPDIGESTDMEDAEAKLAQYEQIATLVLPPAGGNPFFLRELFASLIESDVLQRRNREWQLTRSPLEIVLPPNLRRVVWARVESLPVAAQNILPLLAVIGDQLPVPLLYASYAELQIERYLDEGLDQLEDREFIYRHWHDNAYQFTHALFRSEVYDGIRTEERRRHHQRIGQALLQVHGGDDAQAYAELAHHFYQSIITADQLGGPAAIVQGVEPSHLVQAIHFLVLAGTQANQRYAARQAIAYFQRALQVLQHAPDAEGSFRTTSYEGLGRAHNILGQFEEAISDYNGAIAEWMENPLTLGARRKTADLHRRIGRLSGRLSRFEEAHQHMQQALELLPSPQSSAGLDIVALTHTHTGSLYYLQGQYQRAERSCYQALELLESESKSRVFATTANVLGAVYMATGDGAQAVTWFEQSRDIWEALDDRYHLAQVTDNLGTLHFQRGEFDQAEMYDRQNLAYWHQLEATDQIGHAELNLGSVHLVRGQIESAQHRFDKALAAFKQTGNQKLEALAHNNLGLLALRQGNYEQAKESFQYSARLDENPENLNGLSEANIGLGDLKIAYDLAQQSREQAQAFELRFEEGVTHRTLGKIARHLQQWTEAERLLTNSLELLHQVEARYEMARTLCEKVKLMWAMRRHEEATRIKEEAQILFDEFNLSIETCNDADQRTAS